VNKGACCATVASHSTARGIRQSACAAYACSLPTDPDSLFTLLEGSVALVVGEQADPQLAVLLQAAAHRAQRERTSPGLLPPVAEAPRSSATASCQQWLQQHAKPQLPVWRHVRAILEEYTEAAAAAAAAAAGLPRASSAGVAASGLRRPVLGSLGSSTSASPGPGQAAAAVAGPRGLRAGLPGADAAGGAAGIGGRGRSHQRPGSGSGSTTSGASSTEPCGADTGSVRLDEVHPGDSFSGRWVAAFILS
jgi:hypothetical protein